MASKKLDKLICLELSVALLLGTTATGAIWEQAENNAIEPLKVVRHTTMPNMEKSRRTAIILRNSHIKPAPKQCQTEQTVNTDELDLLARLIEAEAGADYCSDTLRAYVGSVALNRIQDERFPNTLQEVIYQDGQYYCAMCGSIESPASKRSKRIAKELLTGGSQLPAECVWQAEFEQGDGTYYREGRVYICY